MLNQFLFSEFMYEDVSWSGKKSLPTNTAKKNSQVVTGTQPVRQDAAKKTFFGDKPFL